MSRPTCGGERGGHGKFLILLVAVSAVFHLAKGLDYEEALLFLGLLVLLLATRTMFIARAPIPNLRWGGVRLGLAVAAALFYGIAGFWFLDPGEFG